MFEKLRRFLSGLSAPDDASSAFGANDPRMAAAAILVHLIDADGVRTDDELARLKSVIADAYKLSADETERLIAAGDLANRQSVDLYRFTHTLDNALDREAKQAFVEMMWEMVYADGSLNELEDHTLWRVAELIGIERNDRIAIRQRVEARRGIAFDPRRDGSA